MIRTDDLDLVAVHRVHRLPQAAVNPLLDLLGTHLDHGGTLDRATFLLLCDEAEAVAVR